MTRNRKLALLAACLLLGAGVGVTFAAFSSQTSTPTNNFSANSSFGGGGGGGGGGDGSLQMASGIYTGNGFDNRAITGLGFQPDVVIVKGFTTQVATLRTSTMSGDASKPMVGATGLVSNRIQSLAADGFTLGNSFTVNAADVFYTWTAFKASAGMLKVGTYTGNGTTQSITGAGFSPEYAIVASAGAEAAVQRFDGTTRSYRFDADFGTTTRVTSLDADGFSVGADAEVNTSTRTYHLVAWNETAGAVDVGRYAGTGGTQSVGVGFDPGYAIVRSTLSAAGIHRPASIGTSTLSQHFQATTSVSDGITALEASGFRVGSNASASSTNYQYVAFKNTAGDTGGGGGSGCSPTTQTVSAAADSFVASGGFASSNFGTLDTLYVSSGSDNARTLVRFTLPSQPAGCNLTSATLRLYNRSPSSSRTLEAYEVAQSWTETGVTWNNQPGTTGTPATTTTTTSAGWNEWTVTPQVSAMYAGTNNGLLVRDSAEGSGTTRTQELTAREHSTSAIRPQLVVTFGD